MFHRFDTSGRLFLLHEHIRHADVPEKNKHRREFDLTYMLYYNLQKQVREKERVDKISWHLI